MHVFSIHITFYIKFPFAYQLIKNIIHYYNLKGMITLLTFSLSLSLPILPSFSLVLLVFLNMMLFYKLWMLEYSAQSLTTWQGLRLHERYMDIDRHRCTFCTK